MVQKRDLDELDHVNNMVYLQWAQDVAKQHWEEEAPTAVIAEYIWMVLRHEIDYSGQALLGDDLSVRTWVAWSEGVKSERHVEITNNRVKKIIVKVKTLWCLIDAKTKRPTRITSEISEIFHK